MSLFLTFLLRLFLVWLAWLPALLANLPAPPAGEQAELPEDEPPAVAAAKPAYRVIDFPGMHGEPLSPQARAQWDALRAEGIYPEGEAILRRLGPADRALVASVHADADAGGDDVALARRVADDAQDSWLKVAALGDLSDLLERDGDLAGATDAAERAVPAASTDGDRIEARVRLADLLIRAGRNAEARDVLNEIPSARPEPSPVGTLPSQLYHNYDRAAGLAEAGYPEEAVQAYLSYAPQSEDRRLRRAFLTQGLGPLTNKLYKADPAIAARFQLELLKKVPNVAGAVDLTRAARRMSEYEGSRARGEEVHRTVVEQFPDSAAALSSAMSLGIAAAGSGDREAAKTYLERVLRHPRAKLGDRREAHGWLESAGVIEMGSAPPFPAGPLEPRPDPTFAPPPE